MESSSQHLPTLVLAIAALLVGMEMIGRYAPHGQSLASDNSPRAVRRAVIALLLVAAAAHTPVVLMHLEEAPYMGILFIGFILAAFGVATALRLRPSLLGYLLTAGLCATAVGAYVATRLVPFPQLADDVGRWVEPLGLVCIATEAGAVVLSVLAIRNLRRAPAETQSTRTSNASLSATS